MPSSARLPDAAADAPQPGADARREPDRPLPVGTDAWPRIGGRARGLRAAGVLLALCLVAVLGWRGVIGPAVQFPVGDWGAGSPEAPTAADPTLDRTAAVARVLLTHLQGLDPIDRTVALRDWEGALGLGLRWVPPAERPSAAVLRPGEWRRAPDGATLWLAVPRTAELASDAVDLLEVRGLPADRTAGRTSDGPAAVVLVGTLAAASLLLTALALRRRGQRRAHRATLGPFPDGQDLAGLLRREVDALRRDRAREAARGALAEAPGPSAFAPAGLQIDYDPWLEGPVDHEPALLARAVRGLLAQAARRAQRHLVLSARLEGGREVVVEIDDDGPLGGASDRPPPADGESPTGAASDIPAVPDDADWIFAEAVAEWHGGRAQLERAPLGGLRRSLRWPLGWRRPSASAADGRRRNAPGRR